MANDLNDINNLFRQLPDQSEQEKEKALYEAYMNSMGDLDAMGAPKAPVKAQQAPLIPMPTAQENSVVSPYQSTLEKYRQFNRPEITPIAAPAQQEVARPEDKSAIAKPTGSINADLDMKSLERLGQSKVDQETLAGMMRGFEQARAAMTGGALTQIKPDYSTAEGIQQRAGTQYADTLNQMKLKQADQLRKQQAAQSNAFKQQQLDLEKMKFQFDLKKPEIKEEQDIHKENRKERKQLDIDEQKTKELIKQIEDAESHYQKYNKSNKLGTGALVTLGGLTGYASEDDQLLKSKFQRISLDSLVKMFAGMSKAVDTSSERAAFEATQPDIKNKTIVNLDILNTMKGNAERMLAKIQAGKTKYDREGKFIDESNVNQQSAPVQQSNPEENNVVKIKLPDGRIGNIPKANLSEALKRGATEIK
jgi:hypothetical protein